MSGNVSGESSDGGGEAAVRQRRRGEGGGGGEEEMVVVVVVVWRNLSVWPWCIQGPSCSCSSDANFTSAALL